MDKSEVLTGVYIGNGVDNRQITGLGFHPDLVIIKSIHDPTGSRADVHDDR